MAENELIPSGLEVMVGKDGKPLLGYVPSVFVMMAFPLRDTKKNIFKQ